MFPAICPCCLKSIGIENPQKDKSVCPECGKTLDMSELKKKGLIIDAAREKDEFKLAKDYFVNTEFMSAFEHFKKALDSNKNSYLADYFIRLCEIYLNESIPGFDVMKHAVATVREPLKICARANVGAADRLKFIVAMVNEVKIIILNTLRAGDELFETDINSYRRGKISELNSLRDLFAIDREALMSFSPDVSSVLLEIADCAVAVCHKAVQTVMFGVEIIAPSDEQYKQIVSLFNDFSFFAASYVDDYDAKKYTPDFTQNDLLDEKVQSRFQKYDAKNKSNAKKYLYCDIEEYNDILAECDKALCLTYNNCFRSMCDPMLEKRGELLKTGLDYLYRTLTPRVVVNDKRKPELFIDKFVLLRDKFDMFAKFLNAADKFDKYAATSLRAFYARLFEILDAYFIPELEKNSKMVNKLKESKGEEYLAYEKLLFNVACCCACALKTFVPYDGGNDKMRQKLVKECKRAADEFLLLRDYNLNELEQSNKFRPILDISAAVLEETDE